MPPAIVLKAAVTTVMKRFSVLLFLRQTSIIVDIP